MFRVLAGIAAAPVAGGNAAHLSGGSPSGQPTEQQAGAIEGDRGNGLVAATSTATPSAAATSTVATCSTAVAATHMRGAVPNCSGVT